MIIFILGGIFIFEKSRSLVVSETFFDKLEKKLGKHLINGYYETFNNCREEGLVLKTYDNDKELNIWCCECRNTDDIMIVLGTPENTNINNLFDEESWNKRKLFSSNDYDSAIEYVYNQLKYTYDNELLKNNSYKFNINKSMNDIRKICYDAKDLDYEDYYDLASFLDENQRYSCDLIIMDGNVGLRFNKHSDTDIDDLDNLVFKPYEPNLDSPTTLMVGMKEQLDNFIKEELEYSIELEQDIKI